jgi:outer membrane receptor for ferrienterochelin and colicins
MLRAAGRDTISQSETADHEGRFALNFLTPGEYVVTASLEGLAPTERRLVLQPREVQIVSLSLELWPVTIQMDVRADPAPLLGTRSPSSTVLTAARLDSAPAGQRMNFTDVIVTAAPGMIRGHDDLVHIRGHEVALNTFINGVSFWENPHVVFSAGLTPDIIETASVMTGAFSAEYGHRFGGVVDIVTKSGFNRNHDGSVTFSAGEAGRRSLTGDFGGHRGRMAYYLSGSAYHSDRFLSPPDPGSIHNQGRGGRGFLQMDGLLGNAGSLRLLLMGDGTNFQVPKTPLDQQLRPLANATQRTRQQTAILGWTRAASSDLLLGASVYQRWSRAQLLPAAGPLTARARLNRELFTAGTKLDATRFAGRHTVKAGVDGVALRPREALLYDYAGYNALTHLLGWPHIHVAGDQTIAFDGRESGAHISAYVQDHIQLTGRLTADVGVRVDRHDLVISATHASPRVNLAYRVGDRAVLHGSYNHFFVPPPVDGVLSSSAGLTESIREIGGALGPIGPTVENQVEMGVSMPLGQLQLGLTGYYRATQNPVHTTVWPDSRIYSYASFDRAGAYGLEAKAELPLVTRYGVSGYVNYALGRVNFYNPVRGGFVTEAHHVTDTAGFLAPMDQTHTLTGGATYRHQATGLWFGTAVEYGSGTPVGHGDAHDHGDGQADGHGPGEPDDEALRRVPGHFTANLSLGLDLLRDSRRRPRLTIRLDAENITNNVYLVAQEGEFSPAQFSIPRLMMLTAQVRF